MRERFTAKMETGSLKKQLIVDIIYFGSLDPNYAIDNLPVTRMISTIRVFRSIP